LKVGYCLRATICDRSFALLDFLRQRFVTSAIFSERNSDLGGRILNVAVAGPLCCIVEEGRH
jgi:hypothetical protein